MIPAKQKFSERLRYEYPLTMTSQVIDIGCHKGNWSHSIWMRYGCRIAAFEPVYDFFWESVRRFMGTNVHVFPFGASGELRLTQFGVHGDMTGEFSDGESQMVALLDICKLLSCIGFNQVDLMAINCEGGEYDIMERLIESGKINDIKALQVQFHSVGPDYRARMDGIMNEMEKTHTLDYHEEFIWTGWTRK